MSTGHIVFYTFGGIFIVLGIVCLGFAIKYRKTREEYERIAQTLNAVKRFWYLNRFIFFILLAIVCIATSIALFTNDPSRTIPAGEVSTILLSF